MRILLVALIVLVSAALRAATLPEAYELDGRPMPRVWDEPAVRAFYAGWDNLEDSLRAAEKAEKFARQHNARVPALDYKLKAFRQFIREDLVAIRIAVFVTAPLDLRRGTLQFEIGGDQVLDQGVVLTTEIPNTYDRDGLRITPRTSQPAMVAVLLPQRYLGARVTAIKLVPRPEPGE